MNKEKIYYFANVGLILLSIFLLSKTISEIKGWGLIGKDIAPQTTISVSGKGEVVVKPDIATFSFSIQEESLIVSDAQNKVAKSEKEAISFIEKSGVSKDDIKVSGYNIYPRYDYLKTGKQTLVAYVISESIEVKVRDINNAGKIIGSLGELGVTNLSGLTFSVDKYDDIVKQAREKAIADAKLNAKSLAKDLGVSLSRIVNFSENGSTPSPIYYGKAMVMSSIEIATPELPSGTNKIISNVSIIYEIR
ncbi:MAG: SIMPL domain-containing protein [Patescibacteria group bacterium]|nr:SIMPL domain-containing protein [Patescibacteria group bacterium]